MNVAEGFQDRRLTEHTDLRLIDHDATCHAGPDAKHQLRPDGEVEALPGILLTNWIHPCPARCSLESGGDQPDYR
jgi:hypothetical protein